MKTSELGLFWLKDNLETAKKDLRRVEKFVNSAQEGGVYRTQMQLLLDARREVVEVWEKHVKEAEKSG